MYARGAQQSLRLPFVSTQAAPYERNASIFTRGSGTSPADYSVNNGSNRRRRRSSTVTYYQGWLWIINLLVADFIQSLGWVLSLDHYLNHAMYYSPLCTVQGLCINVGEDASGLFCLVIAIHTACLLGGSPKVASWSRSVSTTGHLRWIILMTVWAIAILLSIIGPAIIAPVKGYGPFYGPAGVSWCWITSDYDLARLYCHYLLVFIVSASLVGLYGFVFFRIRNLLRESFRLQSGDNFTNASATSNGSEGVEFNTTTLLNSPNASPTQPDTRHSRLLPHFHKSNHEVTPAETQYTPAQTDRDRLRHRLMTAAKKMLGYPFAYLCLTLPLAICRIAYMTGSKWSNLSYSIAAALYASTGFVNCFFFR